MIKIRFDRIEEKLEIFAFSILVLAQMLSNFFPAVEQILNSNITDSLFAVMLIAIYLRVVRLSKTDKIESLSFQKGIDAVFLKKQKFRNVKIFAYSARNYIEAIARYSIQIDNLCLLLKQASSEQAWFSSDSYKIKKYQAELSEALDYANLLVTSGLVKNLVIKFYQFESYSHFGIFDNTMITGMLIPQAAESQTVIISDVQVIRRSAGFGSADSIIDANTEFFGALFESASGDSNIH